MPSARSLFVSSSLAVVLAACGTDGQFPSCDPEAMVPCEDSAKACLWMHDGDESRYACVLPCPAEGCPNGGACKEGGASSCTTCEDLVDICAGSK